MVRVMLFIFLFCAFSVQSMETTLLALVQIGDSTQLKSVLTREAAQKPCNASGTTLLHFSSTPAVAELLLQHGADINAIGKNAMTPLHAALIERRNDVAQYLLLSGANVHGRSTHKLPIVAGTYAPLDMAISTCNTPLVRLLLAKGADPNETFNKHPLLGWRALHWACHNTDNRLFTYNPQITELLIDNGADMRLQTDDDFNVAHCAATKSDEQFLTTVLTRIPAYKVKRALVAQLKNVRVALMCCFKKFHEVGLPALPRDMRLLILSFFLHRKPYFFFNESEIVDTLVFQQIDVVLQALTQPDNVGRTPWDLARVYSHETYYVLLDPEKVKRLVPLMKASIKPVLTSVAAPLTEDLSVFPN